MAGFQARICDHADAALTVPILAALGTKAVLHRRVVARRSGFCRTFGDAEAERKNHQHDCPQGGLLATLVNYPRAANAPG
jgi:hypothetical protein